MIPPIAGRVVAKWLADPETTLRVAETREQVRRTDDVDRVYSGPAIMLLSLEADMAGAAASVPFVGPAGGSAPTGSTSYGSVMLSGSHRIRATVSRCCGVSMSAVYFSTTSAHHTVLLITQLGQVRGLITPNVPIFGG